jgi:hypothetical protein
MALGGGKKHGRLWIGDGIIDSSSLRLADDRGWSLTPRYEHD